MKKYILQKWWIVALGLHKPAQLDTVYICVVLTKYRYGEDISLENVIGKKGNL